MHLRAGSSDIVNHPSVPDIPPFTVSPEWMVIDVMRGTYAAYAEFGMVGLAKRSKTGCRSFLSNLQPTLGSVLSDRNRHGDMSGSKL